MARRVSRWRTTVPTSDQENARRSKLCGPSRYQTATSSPPSTAPAEAESMTNCGEMSRARIRYGAAFPTVTPPTSAPMASPRFCTNQVAIIFIPGG